MWSSETAHRYIYTQIDNTTHVNNQSAFLFFFKYMHTFITIKKCDHVSISVFLLCLLFFHVAVYMFEKANECGNQ